MSEMRTDRSRPLKVKYLWVLVPIEFFSKAQPSLFNFLYNQNQPSPATSFWYRTNTIYVSLTNVSSVNSVCSEEVMLTIMKA